MSAPGDGDAELERRGGSWPRDASTVVALLPDGLPPPELEELADRLRDAGLEVEADPDDPDALRARRPAGEAGPEERYDLALRPGPPHDHLKWATLTAEQDAAMRASATGVVVTTTFAGEPLSAFHAQLQVAAAAAPDLVGLVDASGMRTHPPEWVRAVAGTRVPPDPAAMFVIHAVSGEREVWLHSHGLRRCGSPELEVLRVPPGRSGPVGHLLNVVAARFVEDGLPPAGEPFAAGEGIDVAWLPWRDALPALGRVEVGGARDRDEAHAGPAACLVTTRKRFLRRRGYSDLAALVPVLAGDPLLFRSRMETARAALLARERLPAFRALHARLGASHDHLFTVKLGFPVDGGDGHEHLWFRVHGFDGGDVDATCLNAPYAVAALAEGRRGRYPIALLSDFAVHTPSGVYDPGRLALLEAPPPPPERLS